MHRVLVTKSEAPRMLGGHVQSITMRQVRLVDHVWNLRMTGYERNPGIALSDY